MRIVCGWCGIFIGGKEGEGVTHTICRSCAEKEKAEFLRRMNLRTIHAVEDVMAMPKKENN